MTQDSKTMTDPRSALIAAASQFYQLGWMVGTSGNLSAKMPDGSFWVTASGKSKGQLQENDFVRVTVAGEVLDSGDANNRPSAETSIHQAIYSLYPEANACYHVHSVEANLVSSWVEGDSLALPPLEMVKGLGVWEENPQVTMPVFDNYLEVPRIAQEIRDRFSISAPQIPALLIRHHGVTVWANSPQTAQNYVEVAEYIFRYIVSARQKQ
jgi:methylthioribulose-1-phosphate dehydratase